MAAREFDLIQRHFAPLGGGAAVRLGIGDDCALLALDEGELLATSIDTQVERVHFPEDLFPEDIGYRSVAAAASDLAAMGARPLGMCLALTLPAADDLWLRTFSEGLRIAGRDFGLPLIGGDTTRGPLTISIQVFGGVPEGQALMRSGAGPGDRVCISGSPGDAAAGLALLQGDLVSDPDVLAWLEQRFLRPAARLELGQSLRGIASAAIDISDGLLADAQHIADASGVCLRIDSSALPLSPALLAAAGDEGARQYALTGGDDYELLFTLPSGRTLPAGCAEIGEVTAGAGVSCDTAVDGEPGYSHF